MSKKILKIKLPLHIKIGNKNYYLSLNNYRNWHYHKNNIIKQTFKDLPIFFTLKDMNIDYPIELEYSFYFPDKRTRDLSNFISVVSKFVEDALTYHNVIKDDNYKIIRKVTGIYKGIDHKDPRCELRILKL